MKISVVTCTWNSEPYLAESIESVLRQSHKDVEYVFVDGGSTDGTLDRIARIPRQVTLLKDVTGGISRAMNAGIQAATGDVVAHLHSDDYYLDDSVLSRVSEVMSKSDAGWCYGRIRKLIGGISTAESYVAPPYSRSSLMRGNYIPHPATFVRREWLLRSGGFSEALKFAMDYDLWLRLSEIGDPIELGVPISMFREHSGSLSSRNRIAAMEEDYQVRLKYAGNNPVLLLEHFLRFLVRRRRILKSLVNSNPARAQI